MFEWCLEHPIMTFILLIVLFSGVKINIATNNWRKEIKDEWRIHELEELICPCEQHDWVEINSESDSDSKKVTITMMCRRCKKLKKEVELA